MKFKELPMEDKPRERLKLYGVEVLSNEELLMILLNSGTIKYSVNELALEILKTSGGLYNMKNMTYQKFKTIDGLG